MKKLGLIFLYSLVPILTISVEDVYFLNKFSSGFKDPQYWVFSKAFVLPPIVLLMLIGIGIAVMLKPAHVNRFLLLIAVVFFGALMTGILVGVFGKIEAPKLFFEFQYWRSLVFFILLVFLIYKVMSIEEFDKFIDWFVLIQFLYSVYALVLYFFFHQGQFSYVSHIVPIFAGDQLAFILFACFILSARNAVKPGLYSVIAELVMILVLFLSLRRAPMAAAVASLVLATGLLLIRNGKGKRILIIFSLGMAVTLILGVILWSTQRAAIESSFIFQRFQSINPFWADQQTNVYLTSMGHTDDFLDGLDLVQQSPILGKGLNTDFVLLRTSVWQKDDLHSTMFSLWVKLGLPGLIFYLLVVTYGMLFFFKGLKSRKLTRVWLVLFVIAFSFFNFITTVYTNGVFLGYKNATCLAIYMVGCIFLSRELSSKIDNPSLSTAKLDKMSIPK
jgi:hypothetical protein